MKYTIGIVDYGAGNLASVTGCLKRLGYHTRQVTSPEGWYGLDAIILPGVGAFASAMASLSASGLDDELKRWVKEGKPLIGICLGMQLLADQSEEFGQTQGLGLIPGRVVGLSSNNAVKGAHIGWNQLRFDDAAFSSLKDFEGQDVFFNHSFQYVTKPEYQLASTDAGERLTAIVRRQNIIGIQFHPERSQFAGQGILKSILEDFLNA